MKTVNKSKTIQLNATGDVKISSWAGNGNLVGNNVRLDGNTVKKGELSQYVLGDAAALKGKTYEVISNGTRVNTSHPEVPVTHKFEGDGVANAIEELVYPEDTDTGSDRLPDPEDNLIRYWVKYTFQ